MKKYLYTLLLCVWAAMAYAQQDPEYPPAPTAPTAIMAAEYFIDVDPGVGAATPIAITPGVQIANVNVAVNVNGLSRGIHRLFIRVRNADGAWSVVLMKEFVYDDPVPYPTAPAAPQAVSAAEYFIDTDPGTGNGTPIAITPGVDIANINVNVVTGSLTTGVHRLYIRTRNMEGKWSIGYLKEFVVSFDPEYPAAPVAAGPVMAAEYFFDTDPGAGNGTPITLTPGTDISGLNLDVITGALAVGTHRLYLRTRSQEGHWSLTHFREFNVETEVGYPTAPPPPQNVVAAEYFIDTDPGTGNGTPISITPGLDLSAVNVNVETATLPVGIHRVYLRTKSQEGRWSLTHLREFSVVSDPEYPTAPPAAQHIVAAEYYVDTDPGTGLATAIPITPGVELADIALTVPTAGLSDGFHRLGIRTRSQEGRWSVTLDSAFYVGTLAPSWTIDPASGHDYGNVAVNSSKSFNFTIRNTGDVAIDLTQVIFSNTAFHTTISGSRTIPARGTRTISVGFNPTLPGGYVGELKIKSNTPGVDSVTTQLRGNGFIATQPPTLSWPLTAPYNGNIGVNPPSGRPGMYAYRIVYKSPENKAPDEGYPRVNIDMNGDQDYTDPGEGSYIMYKEGNTENYVTGEEYSYVLNLASVSATMGYSFTVVDANGNEANSPYKTGPLVTNELADLRLFANDITFSKNNPAPGEPFTMTAVITNSTAIAATNVPVTFFQDDIEIGSTVIASIGGKGTTTVSLPLNYPVDGFYPIKVWIDKENTLGDVNVLNNYAIRPVTVGAPALPGGITVTSELKIQRCPTLEVVITGKATYFGTGTATNVAGAEVTINWGTMHRVVTTDANGNFSTKVGLTCGGNFEYTVRVTDFTFTSALVTKKYPIPCVEPNCGPARKEGEGKVEPQGNDCDKLLGGNTTVWVKFRFRESDPNNFWRSHDRIRGVKVKVYKNDVLIQEDNPVAEYVPGNEYNIPVFVSNTGTGTISVRAHMEYTYVEFLQIPGPTYAGRWTKHELQSTGSFEPEPDEPDLTIRNLVQHGYTRFSFQDVNLNCGRVEVQHRVTVYDSVPGDEYRQIYTTLIARMDRRETKTLQFSDPDLEPGEHNFKIVTDVDEKVDELKETNNEVKFKVLIPKPDLQVKSLKPRSSALKAGDQVQFRTEIENRGPKSGNYRVRFMANGVQIGSRIAVPGMPENTKVTVDSDPYTVVGDDASCGVEIKVEVDANDEVSETIENNNDTTMRLSADVSGTPVVTSVGAAGRPFQARVNVEQEFVVWLANQGYRDARDVSVRFSLNGRVIGRTVVPVIRAGGDGFAAPASFKHTFAARGSFQVKVEVDTANKICEISELNDGFAHISVIDSKQDLEVLSQYISPSMLNPSPGEQISLVGTVKNVGSKVSQPTVLRFMVDDIQIGDEVPVSSIDPGKDLTVAATATYSSLITGVKVMQLRVDPNNFLDEEKENNNYATRVMIVGEAPDFERAGQLTFNPNGFRAGDSVLVSYPIRNKGTQSASAWVRFYVLDANGAYAALDSVEVTLAGGASMVVSKKLLFHVEKGIAAAEIVHAAPVEFDFTNNREELAFSTVVPLTAPITVNGNLDMKNGLPGQLPGWIGGKLLLGDHDLVVRGHINEVDADHFIVTNGTGKLKIVNNDAEKVFPVGTSEGNSNFIKITNTGTPDNFSVGVLPYVLKQGMAGDTLKESCVDRTWLIEEETVGGSNATVEFNWNTADELPLFDRMQSHAAHYNNGKWEIGTMGMATEVAPGRYRWTQGGFTSFSPFAITSNAAALPLRLLAFNATAKGKTAELTWKSEAEVDTKHFVIEHSTNGRTFEDVGTVIAQNRAGVHNYRFTHQDLAGGQHFYRLRMVDIDGDFEHSPIRKVLVNGGDKLNVYPNPAHRSINVSGLAANGIVRIVTMDGRVQQQLRTTGNVLTIDISSLVQGTYVLQYINQGQQQQQFTFIKW